MNKVRIGIVGLRFGEHIVGRLLEPQQAAMFEICAVCDFDAAKREKGAASLGVKAFDNIDTMLAEGNIEAVGLFTGPNGRAALIDKIISAGKDVLTTKPFERDSKEAARVLEKASRLGRVVQMNSPSPLPWEWEEIVARWREKYKLGSPVACRWDIWTSAREKPDGGWYDDPRQCPVAPIYRLGIYQVNFLLRIFGEPQSVQVMESRLFTGRPTSDNAQMGIIFRNGAIANLFCSYCVEDGQPYKNSLTMNFERGTIYKDIEPLQGSEAWQREYNLSLYTKDSDGKTIAAREVTPTNSYQWDVFYRSVRGEKIDGLITAASIVKGIEVMEAMARASISQRTENV